MFSVIMTKATSWEKLKKEFVFLKTYIFGHVLSLMGRQETGGEREGCEMQQGSQAGLESLVRAWEVV